MCAWPKESRHKNVAPVHWIPSQEIKPGIQITELFNLSELAEASGSKTRSTAKQKRSELSSILIFKYISFLKLENFFLNLDFNQASNLVILKKLKEKTQNSKEKTQYTQGKKLVVLANLDHKVTKYLSNRHKNILFALY